MFTVVMTPDPTAMDKILGGISSVMKLSGDMLTYMVDNPVYLFLIAAGFVSVGLGIFRKVRGAAKG